VPGGVRRVSANRQPEALALRDRIEAALGRWGRFVYRRAGWVIALVLLATGVFATQLRHFYLDASTEGFFHADDPIRVQYDAFREAYGRETLILVALRPRDGVFERGFLERLRSMHQEIEDEVPLLAEITSLVNARDTRGYEDRLEVGDFLEDWPESPEALAGLAARARANPMYRNNLLSEDGTLTTIAIETQAYAVDEDFDALTGFDVESAGVEDAREEPPRFLTNEDDQRIAAALHQVLDRHRGEDLEIFVAGSPMFTARLAAKMLADMRLFTGLSIALIALFLGLLFRRLGAVVLPLVTVALTVVTTLALMAATGTPLMPPTQIIPSFLLAVGVGGAVHLLAIFYQARRRGEDEENAVVYALAHSGLPIIMTCLTTAGGLLSFIPAALRPISHFGTFTPIGVIASLFFTLTLLPAMIAVFPMSTAVAREENTASQRLLLRIGSFSTRRASLVIAVWAVILIGACVGLTRLVLGHHMLEWFPKRDPIYQATTLLNEELGGGVSYELLVVSGEENGFHDPELLSKVDRVQRHAEAFTHAGVTVGKTLALTDVVKETHKALNANRDEFYVIPGSRALIAQELLLFENAGSDDVEDFVDSQFSSGRISVRVPFVDGATYTPYLDILIPEIQRMLGPGASVEVTGMLRLLSNTITAALKTMLRSYLSALIVITLLMVMLIGGLGMGLVSMIPNLAPIVFTLGLMGWLGVPLDMFTLMIGTIAIGLAVDDTIHFMHNFRRYFQASGDADVAVERTLTGAGQAMLFTSLVLATGFMVYTQAYMLHLFSFGLLTATAIVMAFIADVTLAPALMKKLARAPVGV